MSEGPAPDDTAAAEPSGGQARRRPASPLPFPSVAPFVAGLGLELHRFEDGHSELQLDVDHALHNNWQVAHGGVVMTMLDVTMALAARSVPRAAGMGVATVEMKTTFIRPAEHRLRSEGVLLHTTATLAFCEARLFDSRNRLCATASGTFKYLRGLARRRDATSATSATNATSATSAATTAETAVANPAAAAAAAAANPAPATAGAAIPNRSNR